MSQRVRGLRGTSELPGRPAVIGHIILNKNGCNVDKIGHFSNFVETTGHTQPGLFWRYMMLIPLCTPVHLSFDHVLK